MKAISISKWQAQLSHFLRLSYIQAKKIHPKQLAPTCRIKLARELSSDNQTDLIHQLQLHKLWPRANTSAQVHNSILALHNLIIIFRWSSISYAFTLVDAKILASETRKSMCIKSVYITCCNPPCLEAQEPRMCEQMRHAVLLMSHTLLMCHTLLLSRHMP